MNRTPHSALRTLELAGVYFLFAGLMQFIYAGAAGKPAADIGAPGHDSFYHLKMAALLPEIGLADTFPWLTTTVFADHFVNHHYGFQLLLSPFVLLSHAVTGDLAAGGRLFNSIVLGLNFLLFDILLIRHGIRRRWIWLLLCLLLPIQFYSRHAFVRAIGISTLTMLVLVWAITARRYQTAALIIALSIQIYLGAVIYLPVIVIAFVLAELIGRFGPNATDPTDIAANEIIHPEKPPHRLLRLVAWTLAGWSIGLLLHPYGPLDVLGFLRLQVFGSGLTPDIPVGREWKSYSPAWFFAQMSAVTLIATGLAICLRLRFGRRITTDELALLFVNGLFLALTFKARRFIEYWPLFATLSGAWLAGPVIDRFGWRPRGEPGSSPRWAWLRYPIVAVMLASALIPASALFRRLQRDVLCKYDLPAIRAVMAELQERSDPGDIVFTDDWDIFPVYFYYNHHNRYIVGLDPKFTHDRDPILWERYVRISRGQVPVTKKLTIATDGGSESKTVRIHLADIRNHFHARFVVTDRDHRKLSSKLDAAKRFAKRVFPADDKQAKTAPYLLYEVIPVESLYRNRAARPGG